MRALFYLLPLTFGCLLKNGFCVISFEEFKKDPHVMPLLEQFKNKEIKRNELLTAVNNIEGLEMRLNTLKKYLAQIKEEAGGGRRNTKFDEFKKNERVMFLVEMYKNEQNNEINQKKLLTEVNKIEGLNMSKRTLQRYLKAIEEDDDGKDAGGKDAGGKDAGGKDAGGEDAGGSRTPISFDQFKNNGLAMSLVGQYKRNKEISNKKKLLDKLDEDVGLKMCDGTLTKYLKKLKEEAQQNPGFDAPPFPQAPQKAQQSSNFTLGNPGSSTSASNKGKSTNFSKASNKGKSTNFSKKNSDNLPLSSIPGSAPHYGDAMPSQQAPPMDDTFVPSQAGTDSMNWLGENLQSNDEDLDSVVRPKNTSLFKRALGFMSSLGGASPQEPQFSPSMHDTSAASSYYPSNQPDDQTLESMITSRNPSSMPYQQVPPMPDRFVPSQAGTDSTDWFGLNAQNNVGDLESMIRKPSSSGDFDTPPFLQAPQIAGQSSNFTSGNPGSSTSPLNKGKITNFSRKNLGSLSSITGVASHYGSAMPSQQAPMDDDTLVPFQVGIDSMNWLGENLQSNDEDLDSVVRPKNTSLFKRALGFMSSLGGASPQEPQFSPSMHDTSAASSYYPSNQPDDQTLQSMTPINQKASHYGAMPHQQDPPMPDRFVPSQAGTDSTNFFGGNWQNNEGTLESMIRKPSSAEGFDGTPFPPNQLQSTGWTGASNYFSPTPNTSNFTSGNPGSSAIPFQQAPMPDISFSAFPNYPANQSAQLNSSTNFVSPQAGTHFLDWSGENSHNNTGTLDSVVNKRKPSSSKDKNATKTGKKPRK